MIADQPPEPVQDAEDANLLAKTIVGALREPLLVLDTNLCVILASQSFCSTFDTTFKAIKGCRVCEIDAGVWNNGELRQRLEEVASGHGDMEDYEIECDFPRIGHRSILLHAHKVFCEKNGHTSIVLGLEDVTTVRKSERALQTLLEQRELLLAEMSHRVANSLQIIAGILLMKARTVDSEETRIHLKDAHDRIMSVASVQQQLQGSLHGEGIEVAGYLAKLCDALARSIIGDKKPITLKVVASAGAASSNDAVSLGLIATELVINAIKHAFPDPSRTGHVVVGYEVDGPNWKLSVSDDGVGMPSVAPSTKRASLGTSLMTALAHQLEAQLAISSSPKGTTVSVTHVTFISRLPTAA